MEKERGKVEFVEAPTVLCAFCGKTLVEGSKKTTQGACRECQKEHPDVMKAVRGKLRHAFYKTPRV